MNPPPLLAHDSHRELILVLLRPFLHSIPVSVLTQEQVQTFSPRLYLQHATEVLPYYTLSQIPEWEEENEVEK